MEIKTQTDALQVIGWSIPDSAAPGSVLNDIRIVVERGMALAPPALTPAQEHAEELHRRLKWALGFVETYAREAMGPATPEWDAVRDVVELVEPSTPPSAHELAEALATVLRCDDAGAVLYREHRTDFSALVDRARRAGLVK